MPRRALVERRPWLLASLAAAIAYYLLKDAEFPGTYLLVIEAASLLFLAGYAHLRISGTDARLLAAAMALGGIGVVVVELDLYFGTVLLVLGLALLIGLFMRNRREEMAQTQKAAAAAMLILTPLIAWLMASGNPVQPTVATFGLAIGGTAAAAWASAYPRYRVGAGAILYLASSLLSMAASGPLSDSSLASLFAWPLFYFGHFLMCTGIVQTLRGDWPPGPRTLH